MSLNQSLSSGSKPPDPSVWKEGQHKSFLDLPNEIISHCIEYVDLPDWVALREVSKDMASNIPQGGPPKFPAKAVLSYFKARAAAGRQVSHVHRALKRRLTG